MDPTVTWRLVTPARKLLWTLFKQLAWCSAGEQELFDSELFSRIHQVGMVDFGASLQEVGLLSEEITNEL